MLAASGKAENMRDYFMLDTKSSFYGFPAKGKKAAHKNCQKFTLVEKKVVGDFCIVTVEKLRLSDFS